MPQQLLMPRAALAVADDAGHRGMVHGDDHRRRGASLAENIATLGNVRDRRPFAAEFDRYEKGKEVGFPSSGDGGMWKDGIAVDGLGLHRCNRCDFAGAGTPDHALRPRLRANDRRFRLVEDETWLSYPKISRHKIHGNRKKPRLTKHNSRSNHVFTALNNILHLF